LENSELVTNDESNVVEILEDEGHDGLAFAEAPAPPAPKVDYAVAEPADNDWEIKKTKKGKRAM
jgi:hypothetical protein